MDVTLFSIMINRLLRDWNIRAKYVDDTTVLEVLLLNSIGIWNFCIGHKMNLNPLKCKEMLVNIMKYPNNIIQPICIIKKPPVRACFNL